MAYSTLSYAYIYSISDQHTLNPVGSHTLTFCTRCMMLVGELLLPYSPFIWHVLLSPTWVSIAPLVSFFYKNIFNLFFFDSVEHITRDKRRFYGPFVFFREELCMYKQSRIFSLRIQGFDDCFISPSLPYFLPKSQFSLILPYKCRCCFCS